jgi:hypothetical protein
MRSHNFGSDWEEALRRWRPSADATFVRTLAQEVRGAERELGGPKPRRWRAPGVRSLVATGMTAALFSALGAFGELGYAASGLDHAVSSIAGAIHISKRSGPAHAPSPSAAADQYRVIKPKTCKEKAKASYDHKIAADRHAYKMHLAAALKARDAALRKCKNAACRIAARTKYARLLAADKHTRDMEIKRDHNTLVRLEHHCKQ